MISSTQRGEEGKKSCKRKPEQIDRRGRCAAKHRLRGGWRAAGEARERSEKGPPGAEGTMNNADDQVREPRQKKAFWARKRKIRNIHQQEGRGACWQRGISMCLGKVVEEKGKKRGILGGRARGHADLGKKRNSKEDKSSGKVLHQKG